MSNGELLPTPAQRAKIHEAQEIVRKEAGRGVWPKAPFGSPEHAAAQAMRDAYRAERTKLVAAAELARVEGYQQALTEVAPLMLAARQALVERAAQIAVHDEASAADLVRASKLLEVAENRVYGTSTQRVEHASQNLHLHKILDAHRDDPPDVIVR